MNNNSCPPFVRKTFQLVSDPKSDNIVSWTNEGKSFTIWNPQLFESEVLPQYFKHNNICSFIRQLNTYSFHKTSDTQGQEFVHPYFYRNANDLSKVSRQCRAKKAIHSDQVEPRISSPSTASESDIFQTLLVLDQKQQESERMLSVMLAELNTTKEMLHSLQTTTRTNCGKRSYTGTFSYSQQEVPVQKIYKQEREMQRPNYIPQCFDDLFTTPAPQKIPNHYRTEQTNYPVYPQATIDTYENYFDIDAMLDPLNF